MYSREINDSFKVEFSSKSNLKEGFKKWNINCDKRYIYLYLVRFLANQFR